MDALISLLPFLIPAIVVFLTALVVGRWWLVFLPVVGWSVFYLGLNAGWWLRIGEEWEIAFVLLTTSGVAAVLVGLLLHVFIFRRKGPRGSASP